MMKKYITDICKEALISHFNILFPIHGAPARSRTQNLLVRSQALYPVELQAHFKFYFIIVYHFLVYFNDKTNLKFYE